MHVPQLIFVQLSAAAESCPFCCFSGGLVPLYLCGRGGLTLLDEWRLLSVHSKLTTSSGCHAAQPLCVPCMSDLFDKTQRLRLKRQWRCSQNPAPALWQTHSQNRCRISDSISRLSAALSAPAAHREVLCPDNTTLPHSLLSAHLVLLLMTPLAGVGLAFTVIMLQYQEGSVTSLEHTDPADRAAPRYSSKLKCRSGGALTVVETVALFTVDVFVFDFFF